MAEVMFPEINNIAWFYQGNKSFCHKVAKRCIDDGPVVAQMSSLMAVASRDCDIVGADVWTHLEATEVSINRSTGVPGSVLTRPCVLGVINIRPQNIDP
ncbi:hypothetical protein E5288_WYG022849 [Bos mutus]|uniref:Uncharacterized protein n=1 Tax=Bos mutus TaxID=72004 RepID=A0A6B0S1K1_9CETA|nr:hypothetical protein [Bos mutus]